jgi:glycerol-3-phosphate acyltransferase PlsY
MQTALIALAAYLLGSISFGVVMSKIMRLPDPRSYGSKNPGATNVLRSGSKIAAAWLAALYTGEAPAVGLDAPMAGLCAFLGHLFPIFHGFRGGKGVATAAGVLIGLDPWFGLAALVTFAAIVAFFRMVSLASIVAALFASFYAFWLFGLRPITGAVVVMALLLIVRHHANIGRIVRGEEAKLGRKGA